MSSNRPDLPATITAAEPRPSATTPTAPSSLTPTRPSLPSILDREAWAAPASTVEIAAAVGALVALVEPGAAPARSAVLARAIASRGYTSAEIALVAAEAPFANHYGPHVRLDVVDGLVRESRRLRAMLERRLSDDERAELTAAHPEVPFDDFVPAGYNSRGETLWLYKPDVAALRREALASQDAARFEAPPGTVDGSAGWREIAEAEEQRVRAGLPPRPPRRPTASDGTRTAAAAARSALVALGAPQSVLDSVEAAVQDAGEQAGAAAATTAPVPESPQAQAARAALARARTPEEMARILDALVPTPYPAA